MKPEDFELLMERHLDGSLTESERLQLTSALEEFEWTKEAFVKRLTLAADLKARITPESTILKIPAPSASKRYPLKRAALALAACVMLGFVFFFPSGEPAPKVRILAAEGIGTLDTAALERGEDISLKQGILEIELNGESRIVIEGPATFGIDSPRHMRLISGRCYAEMKEGKSGLVIETPSGEVLDLGTQFAVDVSSPFETKVHVFDGAVEISDGTLRKKLIEGQAIKLAGDGTSNELNADSSSFLPRVPRAVAADSPHVHWSFEEGQGNTLKAFGTMLESHLGDGNIIVESIEGSGVSRISGPVGSALSFGGNVWVDTSLEGISGGNDRTVSCWIKLQEEAKSRDTGALISWGNRQRRGRDGEINFGEGWMLSIAPYKSKMRSRYGVLRLNVGAHTTYGSTNLRDGKWHHVAAVTIGGEYGTSILFYVDGKLEATERNELQGMNTNTEEDHSSPVRFGRHLFMKDRFLNGALDEVYLFDAALSGDEIRSLMLQGQPPQ